jgi:hypothetical protein
VRLIPWRGAWAAVIKKGFTWNLDIGRLGEGPALGYWCFSTKEAATTALVGWSGGDDADGWSWRPKSRRHRPGGQRTEEFIEP